MDRSVFKILISNSGAFPFRFHLSHRYPPVRWRGKLKNPAPALTLKPERSGPLPTLDYSPRFRRRRTGEPKRSPPELVNVGTVVLNIEQAWNGNAAVESCLSSAVKGS